MTQAGLWAVAGGAAAVALAAGLADRRRSRRPNLDRPGWMPWPAIQILAMIAAALAAAYAIKL